MYNTMYYSRHVNTLDISKRELRTLSLRPALLFVIGLTTLGFSFYYFGNLLSAGKLFFVLFSTVYLLTPTHNVGLRIEIYSENLNFMVNYLVMETQIFQSHKTLLNMTGWLWNNHICIILTSMVVVVSSKYVLGEITDFDCWCFVIGFHELF